MLDQVLAILATASFLLTAGTVVFTWGKFYQKVRDMNDHIQRQNGCLRELTDEHKEFNRRVSRIEGKLGIFPGGD